MLTYKDAGVDVHAGYEAVRLMKPHTERTFIPGVLGGLGGFGGCFELPKGYENPVMVSGTDSVGTKLKIAFLTGKHTTVGIDCVAMCVNDIICQGAKPLFFLDYIGIGKLDPKVAADLVSGVSEGCVQAGCALIGGETAELPGLYREGEYDLAGFAVGIAEKSKLLTGADVKKGDALIGIASSGLHSNGFTLVREILLKDETPDKFIPELNDTIGEALLTPTKIYAKLMTELLSRFKIKGAAHITGGGWTENIPRLAGGKDDVKAVVNMKAVDLPPIFEYIKNKGNLSLNEMYNTFNMGVGMVLAAEAGEAEDIVRAVGDFGEKAYIIGTVEERKPGEEPIIFV
jgi:phosphoribosylformylglycinamidine cyclo-ligase